MHEKLHEKSSEKLHENLSGLQKKIVELMRADPKITYDELIKSTNKSREGLRKNIQRLKEAGIVKRIGPDKGGHWKVIEP